MEEPLYVLDDVLACETGELDELCELTVLLRDVGVADEEEDDDDEDVACAEVDGEERLICCCAGGDIGETK